MDRRTVLIVGAIIVVGGLIAFAGDLDPPEGPIGPTMHTLDEIYAAVVEPQCCSPRPEDIRRYFFPLSGIGLPGDSVAIPVEGNTGFVLTDITGGPSSGFMRISVLENEEEVLRATVSISKSEHLISGIPFSAGTTLTVENILQTSGHLTVTGYVY